LNRSLAFEKAKLEAVLTGMADGVLVTDDRGRVILINTVASAIFDEQCLGRENLEFSDLFTTPRFGDVIACVLEEQRAFSWEYSPQGAKDLVFKVLASAILDGRSAAAKFPATLQSSDGIEGVVFVLRNISDEKRLDRMKTQFLSMVSHELKTPLTSIQGFVELLLFREYPEERRRQFLTISLEECHRLMRLFDNLLTLSRLEAGQFQYHKETVLLDTLVGYLVENFKAQHLNHRFVVTVEGKPYPVHADSDMLAQVITNLLSNAVKYSPRGGTIRLAVRNRGANVEVAIADEGVGIPQDKLPYIFEKFYRVDTTLTRETGGAGLGLANARYIVEGHGGSIRVDSRHGEGSVFTFTIPAVIDDKIK
jgi:signal transduction histidine kinase